MRVALVTTPASVRSGIGDYTRHLLPYLRERCDVRLFVDGEPGPGEERARGLDPRDHDRILYQLGNELRHAFMLRMIRELGGTVVLHDWVLFDTALRAFPGLERGGWKGHLLALREGGPDQARRYARNWLDRRRQRTTPAELPADLERLEGPFLCGWHSPEEAGRWTDDAGVVRLPARGVRAVEVTVSGDPGRAVELRHGAAVLARHAYTPAAPGARLAAELEADEPVLRVATAPVAVTAEQRRNGDPRRLGSFVQALRWRDGGGWHELDLALPTARPIAPVTLSRDRFELPLNRSAVRFGDAFITHSMWVKQRILRERNSATPVGVLHHGAEIRWRDEDRRVTRARLGLSREWVDGFLLVSFGGVQPHKRIDKVYAGVALARRERPDVRLVMAGGWTGEGASPGELARRHGLEGAVHVTGYLPEREAWDWIHAGDVSINLRGPSSGGTSGGIFQSLAQGRAVIATDACEQAELPDACIPKVPLGEGEVEAVARTLVELARDPARRDRLERAAREFVERECHWGRVAERYAEYLEAMPPPRSKKRPSIPVRVLRELRARGAEKAAERSQA